MLGEACVGSSEVRVLPHTCIDHHIRIILIDVGCVGLAFNVLLPACDLQGEALTVPRDCLQPESILAKQADAHGLAEAPG